MLLLHNNIYKDFCTRQKSKERGLTNEKYFMDYLRKLQPILGGLFFVFLCLLTGQFGWALVIGVMTLVAAVAIVLIYWKDYKR